MRTKTRQELEILEKKYYDLVWFARKEPFDHPYWISQPDEVRDIVFRCMTDVIDRMPEETAALCGDSGDWQHGFNSGMLAALRFFMEAEDGSLQFAKDTFPMLDT